ncbi:MAG: acyltransferase, partial [Burkholderiaceae bacterium]
MKTRRLLQLDALKALAAQLIVLHHLSAYGPVADAVQAQWPALIDWLYEYGRVAVQIFLVLGGYLAARALSGERRPWLGLVQTRWLRLALPFMAAVLITLVAYGLAARALPELLPENPVSALQLLAHALLLHDVLGFESLTVGAWYVAIDLQLYALMAVLICYTPRFAPWLALGLVAASLAVFNRDSGWDSWAVYFFGAYGLGALVWLWREQPRRLLMGLVAALSIAALWLEWRDRIALAGVTALLLAWNQGRPWQPGERLAAGVAYLGQHSYALFLIHFAVLLLVNAGFVLAAPEQPWIGLVAMLGAWLLSNLAAEPFHRWVELPASRL